MIVFPMVGLSQRFFAAGYNIPKYMLPLQGGTIFSECVRGFREYFDKEEFLFICRPDYDTPAFVQQNIDSLGISAARIAILDHPTSGQAETVFLGLNNKAADFKGALTIFNVDTIQKHFKYPDLIASCDGYLEVFEESGNHWSFVEPVERLSDSTGKVGRVVEKERISDLCSTGLYYFSSAEDFVSAYHDFAENGLKGYKESYVAPIYNFLIKKGYNIMFKKILRENLLLSGTPTEYELLLVRGLI